MFKEEVREAMADQDAVLAKILSWVEGGEEDTEEEPPVLTSLREFMEEEDRLWSEKKYRLRRVST